MARIDLPILLFLALAGATASWIGADRVHAEGSRLDNVWFQADIGRVYANMTERRSDHYRTKVHPLFSIATNPPVQVLNRAGLGKERAVRIVIAGAAGLWLAILYGVLCAFGLRRLDAVVFAGLAAVSSSAMFWSTVPERYVFGSITLLLVMGFAAFAASRKPAYGWFVGFSALSLSMTVTNWMAGLLVTWLNNSWWRSVRITRDAFLLVTLVWTVQHAIFPTSKFFLLSTEERKYVLVEAAGGLADRLTSFFLNPMVMPTASALYNPLQPRWPMFSIQLAPIGSTGALGWVMTLLWIGLLAVGIRALVNRSAPDKPRIALGLTLLGQFALHLVYGEETFLYSLHWLPLLVIVAGIGTLGPQRWTVVAAGTMLAIGAGFNNLSQFAHVTSELYRFAGEASERAKLLAAMEAAPEADWPRGEGHVLLAPAVSMLEEKGYHEPGGNFSPGFRTFGISFAFFDSAGELAFTSNSLPLDEVAQRLDLENGAIQTQAAGYDAEWRVAGEQRWRLRLRPDPSAGLSPVLRVTSAGPAGGPIESLHWHDRSLVVNDAFVIQFDEAPLRVIFDDERNAPSLEGSAPQGAWSPPQGFGSASMLLDPGAEHTIEVFASDRDSVDERLARNESSLRIALPDASFRDSLKAQIFHIRAGTVGDETRPGDPANYDVNWLRDGAYEVVALARFGEGELARRLSRRFATHDFFGGFGAEADAPGLAIWTLEEVSARLRDPEYDRSIWPHVLRKADLIEEMLDSEGKVFKPFSGPIVPRHRGQKYEELSLVAEPARNGLILGKMDNQRPIFYVNATAYLGLTRAAEVAKRVGRNDDARRFLDHARQLRMDWERALKTDPDRLNPRTRIAGLWPSGIVDQRRDTFQRLLEDSWKVRRGEDGSFEKRPAWTYFEVAEAHQWLLLGRPERAWLTLEWFWSHQTSPGLYTWWEGNGEENSFQLWPTSRGWVRPRHVTPHYWTAAEVAHLQLDMLAYETNAPGQTRVVIGTGVRPKWLDVPMSVNGLSLRSGVLDWAWDGETLTIDWRGQPGVEFAAGPAFPASTRIAVRTPVTSH